MFREVESAREFAPNHCLYVKSDDTCVKQSGSDAIPSISALQYSRSTCLSNDLHPRLLRPGQSPRRGVTHYAGSSAVPCSDQLCMTARVAPLGFTCLTSAFGHAGRRDIKALQQTTDHICLLTVKRSVPLLVHRTAQM